MCNNSYTGEIDELLPLKVDDSGNTTTIPSITGLRTAVSRMLDIGGKSYTTTTTHTPIRATRTLTGTSAVEFIVVSLSTSTISPTEVLDSVYGISVITVKGTLPNGNTPYLYTTAWGST